MGDLIYTSTHFLTSEVEGDNGKLHALASLPGRKGPR